MEWLHFHFSLSCIGEGNGNPLQCSCLENPRDGGPGRLPSMGLQSQTQLKRLNSSSSSTTTISVFPMSSTLGTWEEGILCTTATKSELHFRQSSVFFLCPAATSWQQQRLTWICRSYIFWVVLLRQNDSHLFLMEKWESRPEFTNLFFCLPWILLCNWPGSWYLRGPRVLKKKKSFCFVHFNTGPLLCV